MAEDDEGGGGFDFDILAKLHLAIGGVGDEIRESDKRRAAAALEAQGRRVEEIRDFTTAVGGTTGTWRIGSPERGFFWLLRRVWIGGNIVTSVPTGTAYAFARPSTPAELGPADMFDYWSALGGAPHFYTSEQVMINERQSVWIYVTGAPNSTQLVCTLRAMQYPVRLYKEILGI